MLLKMLENPKNLYNFPPISYFFSSFSIFNYFSMTTAIYQFFHTLPALFTLLLLLLLIIFISFLELSFVFNMILRVPTHPHPAVPLISSLIIGFSVVLYGIACLFVLLFSVLFFEDFVQFIILKRLENK